MSAKVGDIYSFDYPNDPQFDCVLTVVRVLGQGPEDTVFFNDQSRSKQKDLVGVKKIKNAVDELSRIAEPDEDKEC